MASFRGPTAKEPSRTDYPPACRRFTGQNYDFSRFTLETETALAKRPPMPQPSVLQLMTTALESFSCAAARWWRALALPDATCPGCAIVQVRQSLKLRLSEDRQRIERSWLTRRWHSIGASPSARRCLVVRHFKIVDNQPIFLARQGHRVLFDRHLGSGEVQEKA